MGGMLCCVMTVQVCEYRYLWIRGSRRPHDRLRPARATQSVSARTVGADAAGVFCRIARDAKRTYSRKCIHVIISIPVTVIVGGVSAPMDRLKRAVRGRGPAGRAATETGASALETPAERRARWRSVYVIYFTMFLMSLGFSVVLTGVWPYLDKLDPSAGKLFLGLVVAAHPLGQMLFSPLLGWWANRAGNVRVPLLASLALFVVASALYSMLYLTRPYAKYYMVAARFLVGVSSANVAVARSYLSAATLVAERTRAVAAVSLAQVLGFVVGPALQAAVTPLGAATAPEPPRAIDMYTAAGWLNAALGVLNFALFLPCCFEERPIALREANTSSVDADGDTSVSSNVKPDYVSAWTLVVAFFVLVFNFVLLETLATSLTMDQFGWNKRQALEYMGMLMSAGALVACCTFVAIGPLSRIFEERALLLWGGFLPTALGSVACIPWGPNAPPLAPETNVTEAVGGCPQSTQPWCANSLALRLPQFFLGYACVSVGYPLGVTLIQSIFSKVLGPRPQGVWMGVLTGAGCLSRVLGPLFVSAVYAGYGPLATFGVTSATMAVSMLWIRCVYSRLAPEPPRHPAPVAPADVELRPLKTTA